jgi:glucosylceramidase
MNRIKVLGLAYLLALAGVGCTSSTSDSGSGGDNNTGSGGETAGVGGTTGTGAGGSTNPGAGGSTNPGAGGSTNPGAGGSTNPGAGGSTNPGAGGSTNPGAGGSGMGGAAPAQQLVTSADGAYWTTTGTLTTVTTGTADVTVNDTTTAQTWEGFGGAFNELGWLNLQTLSAADHNNALQLLFGTNGAHFGMGRIPIGASDYACVPMNAAAAYNPSSNACDLAKSRYTENESSGDTAMANFSISRDMNNLIPYVKAAMGVNPNMRFWASPWTPPTWMKTRTGSVSGISCGNVTNNGKTDSNVFDGGCMQDIAANLTGLGLYFVKWIQAYQAQGITIDTLAPQNEPDYAQGYPSAIWAPALYTKFIPILNTALTQASLSTKIMLGTMSNGDNGQQSKDLTVVTTVFADATAKGLVKNLGLQWGMLDIYEGLSGSSPSWLNLPSGFPVWATEHKCGNYPWGPTGTNPGTNLAYTAYVSAAAPNDHAYGYESWAYIRNAIKAGVTSYNAWNMVLDYIGWGNDMVRPWAQDTLISVTSSASQCKGTAISAQLCATPAYYVFRHLGQFVQVGAKVVATTGSNEAVAFKNPDGTIVLAMYNSGAAKNAIVQIAGKKLQFAIPATGWATVVSK